MFATFLERTLYISGTASSARDAYNEYYSTEVDLNDTFNKFASNYCLAYQGPNTAHAQIGSKFSTSECVAKPELSAVVAQSCILMVITVHPFSRQFMYSNQFVHLRTFLRHGFFEFHHNSWWRRRWRALELLDQRWQRC